MGTAHRTNCQEERFRIRVAWRQLVMDPHPTSLVQTTYVPMQDVWKTRGHVHVVRAPMLDGFIIKKYQRAEARPEEVLCDPAQ